METSHFIRLNIKHYEEILKLEIISEDQRQAAIKLLAVAEQQLPFAIEEESELQYFTSRRESLEKVG